MIKANDNVNLNNLNSKSVCFPSESVDCVYVYTVCFFMLFYFDWSKWHKKIFNWLTTNHVQSISVCMYWVVLELLSYNHDSFFLQDGIDLSNRESPWAPWLRKVINVALETVQVMVRWEIALSCPFKIDRQPLPFVCLISPPRNLWCDVLGSLPAGSVLRSLTLKIFWDASHLCWLFCSASLSAWLFPLTSACPGQ